jgi:hypothetical protein
MDRNGTARSYGHEGSASHTHARAADGGVASAGPVVSSAWTRCSTRFEPVTAQRGADLDTFSRGHGKFRYCLCMRWRLPSAQYQKIGREGRAAARSRNKDGSPSLGVAPAACGASMRAHA